MPVTSFDTVVSWHTRPAIFWTMAFGATALWLGATWGGRARAKHGGWLLWSLASIALMLAWRWPYMLGPAIMNPDEAQMIAGAITLKSHPVFWKYVDGTTHGPLNDFVLLFAHLFGAPLNYAGARLVGGILVIGGFLFAGRGLMSLYPAAAVRVGLAPVILLWSTICYYDFTGYTSEQVAVFLILVSIWPLAAAQTTDGRSGRCLLELAAGGFLLGAVPYAKLQGVPIAFAIGVVAIVAVLSRAALPFRQRIRSLAVLVGGALLPSLLVAIHLWIWGLEGQFWASYILNNLDYISGAGAGIAKGLRRFWPFLHAAPGLQTTVVLIALMALSALGLLARPFPPPRPFPWMPPGRGPVRKRLQSPRRRLSALGAPLIGATTLLALSSVYATLSPGALYGHYLQFLGIPLGLIGVIACGEIAHQHMRVSRFLPLAAITAIAIPLTVARMLRADPGLRTDWVKNAADPRHPASIAIARLAQPGDTLSVWGWMPYFYVETGLPQGTREANTYRQIEPLPMRTFYRDRYLRDLCRWRPRIFVDAVGGRNFSYDAGRRPTCAHEAFPGLASLIEREYRFVEEVDGSRIYLRK